jgi:hypothetical protein
VGVVRAHDRRREKVCDEGGEVLTFECCFVLLVCCCDSGVISLSRLVGGRCGGSDGRVGALVSLFSRAVAHPGGAIDTVPAQIVWSLGWLTGCLCGGCPQESRGGLSWGCRLLSERAFPWLSLRCWLGVFWLIRRPSQSHFINLFEARGDCGCFATAEGRSGPVAEVASTSAGSGHVEFEADWCLFV